MDKITVKNFNTYFGDNQILKNINKILTDDEIEEIRSLLR